MYHFHFPYFWLGFCQILNKTKNMKKALLLSLVAIAFLACDREKLSVKPAHTGAAGEIVVIADDSVWNNGLEESMTEHFRYYLPMLPQPEAACNVGHYTPEQFSMIIERHRNIFQIEIDPKMTEGRLTLYKDKWAQDQLVVEIKAPNAREVNGLLELNHLSLVQVIDQMENERLAGVFSTYPAKGAMRVVKEKFGVDVVLPKGFEVAKSEDDFIWVKREKSRNLSGTSYFIIQNFCVYTYPYDTQNSFEDSLLLKNRDRYVKKIPGSAKGSYMTTVYSFQELDLYPEGKDVMIDDAYAREIRGLWKMENDFMGGPFISLSTLNETKDKIICIEGQVFAPKFDKREYLREMEAVLYSFKQGQVSEQTAEKQ